MRIAAELTDIAIAQILGERIARYRIEAGLTQADLAERAGIGKRTVERMEAGRGIELVTLIRVLRTLGALAGLEGLLPELPPSPIEQLKLRGKQRRRVARPRGHSAVRESAPMKPWTWGVPADKPAPIATRSRATKRRV